MYNLLDCFKAKKKLLVQISSWGGNTQTKNTLLRLNLCHCGIYESPGFSQSQGHGLSSQAITPWALATQACVSSGKQRAPPTNAATTAAATTWGPPNHESRSSSLARGRWPRVVVFGPAAAHDVLPTARRR